MPEQNDTEGLTSPHHSVRLGALTRLAPRASDPLVAAILVPLLQDEDEYVIQQATRVLVSRGDRNGALALVQQYPELDDDARAAVIDGLLFEPASAELLVSILRGDGSTESDKAVATDLLAALGHTLA